VIVFWRRRAAGIIVALFAVTLPMAACGRSGDPSPKLAVTWNLSPSAPAVGPAVLIVTLRDSVGAPVKNAAVRLEAQMTHAGMAPVFATATERPAGVYDLSFAFTMQGDWALLVSATPPDGARTERRIDVNVKP
jgi:hypothetical protein